MTTTTHGETRSSSPLHVESWGEGTPVVLVHGSLAVAAEEWAEQRPLAEEGFHLLAPDRRGYGRSAAADGEDFERDAADVEKLMGRAAHLVGHSYGGLGVMLAAASRPDATLSMVLLEPATLALAQDVPAARALCGRLRALWNEDLSDEEWVVTFLRAVGSDPESFPPDFLASALPLVPVFRRGRPAWEAALPLAELARAPFPKFVVSGGHTEALEAICDELANRIDASRMVIEGAGHEIQFTGTPINDVLRALWSRCAR